MSERPIVDQAERDRIDHDLDTNLLVEAGAGSGKTRALLERLQALIRTGRATVAEIAAVTFTRKAAAELRERFQAALEESLRTGRDGTDAPEEIERLATALHDIEHGFIGTIHAFCARLLRERPLEAGLDPAFREVFGPEEERLKTEAWERHLEQLTTAGDPSLERLRAVNLEPSALAEAYVTVVEQPDVTFPADVHQPPAVGDLRGELEKLLKEGLALMPDREPDKGWCNLQSRLRRLQQTHWNNGWDDDAVFLDALEIVVGHKLKPTYKRWGVHSDDIRPVEAALTRFAEAGGAADAALRQWHAYRYKIVLDFVRRAADAYAMDRRRRGVVTFNDLLMETARLLRTSPSARRDFAARYRYLLVDEFQDTDPLQAEIVFLLTADDPEVIDWHEALPRPGALFVVGDPKQSIYRFRRADIGIYNQVKELFEERGEVLLLTTNFRSQPPVEAFVNGIFEHLLPAQATTTQAAFAPLNVHNDDDVQRGVYWYEVACSSWGAGPMAAADAPLVASWIKQRIDAEERKAGDFMILTRVKSGLSAYGAELEKRGIPFQITGAGVDIGEQLQELVIVLRALDDPHDPVRTAAALVGLFFGIDHEQLVAHRLAYEAADVRSDSAFEISAPADDRPAGADPAVGTALGTLRRWWLLSLRLPADVVVAAIIDELGLFPYLAAGEAGGSNAGALAYVMNAVRTAGVNGDTSLRAALDALEEALQSDDVEAPLQPGRDDVVRVMNLHKAKGLEAEVVILAHPAGEPNMSLQSVVQRPEKGAPRGAFIIQRSLGRSSIRIAAPLDWDEMAAQEAPFEEAERTRLLYVAATRARRELVFAYYGGRQSSSPWQPFHRYREALATRLDLSPVEPAPREPLQLAPGEMARRVAALQADRAGRAAASYEITSVTKMVKHDTSIFAVDGGGLGRAWGNAVHEALEAANRGADESIRAICRTALLDNDLPVNDDGAPADLDDLVVLVEGVCASETWQRAQDAEETLVEAPFALEADDGAKIVEGVIDLAFREADGWVIVDYKTDMVDDEDNLARRRGQYRAQVDAYARYFERISGATVKERQLLWVGRGEVEVW
ncbi:MAG: UvrD-helicase domain-containing protein [Acidobacteriota bacterium]|jgi:ATP-dependent helicase/nuclease subunit A